MDMAQQQLEDVLEYMKRYGSGSLAYSALQEGIEHYVEDDKGFIAYTRVLLPVPTTIILADPVCAPVHRKKMLSSFLKKVINPIFIHLTSDTAKILEEMGFIINEMGVETILDVQQFGMKGSKKEFLRNQRNRACKDGLKAVEMTQAQVPPDALKAISEEWMSNKAAHRCELTLLARPAVFEDEPGVRKFYAMKDGVVIGYVFFDPMYRGGKTIGYIANILRSLPKPYSVSDFLILEAMNVFKAEGVQYLSLGASPFADVDDDGQFNYSHIRKNILGFLFQHCNHLYSFKSLAFHKKMYRPGMDGTEEVKIYCAAKRKFAPLSLYGVLRRMGIKPILQTMDLVTDTAKTKASEAATKGKAAAGAAASRAGKAASFSIKRVSRIGQAARALVTGAGADNQRDDKAGSDMEVSVACCNHHHDHD